MEPSDFRIADAIASALATADVRWVFGHPGGEVIVLVDALRRAGIEFILTHHEATAAFAAGGVGEVTGRPGVCLATLGPGATNMVTGVANAFLDRAPLLAFTGALATDSPSGKTHQDLDLCALYANITKASISVTEANARDVVPYAWDLSTSDRMGPVHLNIPSDIASRAVATSPLVKDGLAHGTPRSTRALPPLPGAGTSTLGTSSVEAARCLVEESRLPVIVVGLGGRTGQVGDAMTALAESVGAAVVVTPKTKGVLDERHPLFAGVLEVAGDDLIMDFLRQGDLIVTVGLDVVELDKPWRFAGSTIRVDSLPDTDGFYEPAVELVGDIAGSLRQLIPRERRPGWPQGWLKDHRTRLHSALCPEGSRLQPWQVVMAVRAAFGDEVIATSDTGAHKFLVSQLWETRSKGAFFVSNGLSSMGFGIPVAAAARLARPEQPVVAFVGDGGLGMYQGELATLQRLGLDLTIVVFADGSLEMIRRSQVQRGVAEEATSFRNPDLVAVAAAHGVEAWAVRSPQELQLALNQVQEPGGVKMIVALIDGADYRL